MTIGIRHVTRIAIAMAVGAFLMTAFPASARAQEDVTQKTIPSLEMDQADVREAVRALFKNVSISYLVSPDVQGTVTVSMRNVTFETALQNILRQVDATYRVEGGVYEIVKRAETVAPTSMPESTVSVRTTIVRRIKIRSADPQFIAAMLGMKAGNQSYTIAPEMSTLAKNTSSGIGGGRSGMGSSGTGMGSGLGSGSSGLGSSGFGNSGVSSGMGGGSSGRIGG